MKNILFSLALIVSLIVGSTAAFADMSTSKSGQSQRPMQLQDLKKGLKEAIVIPSGKETWVVHQPKEQYPHFFTATTQGKVSGNSNRGSQSKQG